jgi:hypothetical protein
MLARLVGIGSGTVRPSRARCWRRAVAHAETTHRDAPVDAHAPDVVGYAARERFDANGVVAPKLEGLPSR